MLILCYILDFHSGTSDIIEHEFIGAGQPQRWRNDDQSWLYQLPFPFPFFGREHDKVYVCSNGYLDFSSTSCSYSNSTDQLKSRTMIAPLWDDLKMDGNAQAGEDIYIHQPSPESVCIRWAGELYESGDPVNFEVILYEDGRIRFDYGSGNTDLSPTVGLSGGGGRKYKIATYDGSASLNNSPAISFTPHEHTITITLDQGWNLISLPVMPADDEVGRVLGAAESGLESVWSFKDGSWQVYVPGHPEFSVLESMKPGYGYWVKANKEGVELQIKGEASDQAFSLNQGWNLVGFQNLETVTVLEASQGIDGDIDSIWGYNDAWELYNPQNPGLSNLYEITPGRGFWVNLK